MFKITLTLTKLFHMISSRLTAGTVKFKIDLHMLDNDMTLACARRCLAWLYWTVGQTQTSKAWQNVPEGQRETTCLHLFPSYRPCCQTLPGLPRAARPSGRFAEGKYRIYFGLNMRQSSMQLELQVGNL